MYGERLFTRDGFLAGSDDARLEELTAALTNPDVRAIVCARGGYGLMRILSRLPIDLLRERPRPIVGFSDVTALHAWAARAGVVALHAPVVTQLGDLPREDADALVGLLESTTPPPPLGGLRLVAGSGVAEGPLVGGNLEIVSRLVGTPFAFDLDGAVLLLEDVGERPYRVDRALTQLELSGAFRRLAGAVLGDFVGCVEKDGSPPTVEEVLRERLGRFGVPILAGAPVGHGRRNRALPLGVRVRLDGAAGTLTFLEPAVSAEV
jgi:muramoyltetrapeptide carboxypeptidase